MDPVLALEQAINTAPNTAAATIAAADEALYDAKDAGRNRIATKG